MYIFFCSIYYGVDKSYCRQETTPPFPLSDNLSVSTDTRGAFFINRLTKIRTQPPEIGQKPSGTEIVIQRAINFKN
ncbi:MAG: hypothetical protein J6T98_09510 [Salinivirgaceae bacterium]|nr:hypothetical protein [Salinivirgaceae bacterium]